MIDKDKAVQGYVIYAEFTRMGFTKQIFFTPDGFTLDGSFVPMRAHYRTVSADTPRKQWKTSTALYGYDAVKDAVFNAAHGSPYDPSIFTQEWANERLRFVESYISHLAGYGWEMVQFPLVVEASRLDLDEVKAFKTPTKIIYRINQSRVAAGFPAELF